MNTNRNKMTKENTNDKIEEIIQTESHRTQNNSRKKYLKTAGRAVAGGLLGALAGASLSLFTATIGEAATNGPFSTIEPSDIYSMLPIYLTMTGTPALMGAFYGAFRAD